MDVGRIDVRTQFRLKDTQQSQLVVGILGGTYIRHCISIRTVVIFLMEERMSALHDH